MSCKKCGRHEGHYLGCPAITVEDGDPAPQEPTTTVSADEADVCAADGCQDAPKPYGGRGAKPKYCTAHSKTK